MRIHVTGASGSGTSTLGAALASALKGRHFEADDYYWLPTSPPFTEKRAAPERLSLLTNHLNAAETPVLAGSIVGWGPQLEDSFDFIVFPVSGYGGPSRTSPTTRNSAVWLR